MGSKIKRFADDGWAVWIDGDEKSTVYFNEWINPGGKNYVDVGIRIYGARNAREANIFIPFEITKEEIEDLSSMLTDAEILRGVFNNSCRVNENKDSNLLDIKYGKHELNVLKLSDRSASVQKLSTGALITIGIEKMRNLLTADELYLLFRIPHKSMNAVFEKKDDMTGFVRKLHESITSPVVTEKYGYAIRINEARLLTPEISDIEALHQQNLRKALVSISISDDYELNDYSCYRIRRLEENIYGDYAPCGFDCSSAINYQWVEERDNDMKTHYNFYFDISCSTVSKKSLVLYFCIVLAVAAAGNTLYGLLCRLFELIFG